MKMYHELAEWWPLLSAPKDYAEEAAAIEDAILSLARRPVKTLLELGSGGGNNASHLKARFAMTLCDASHEMLAVSMALNPECEHGHGDMRTVRLDRTFDAVLIHDAIMYMSTEDDLNAAIATAAAHLAPGGAAVFVPDHTTETYLPESHSGGEDGETRALRYLEWSQERMGTAAVATFVILLKEGDGPPRVVTDHHVFGVFDRATWVRLIEAAGLEAHVVREAATPDLGPVLAGVRPDR
jgi:trans-aconitate methyltransferase